MIGGHIDPRASVGVLGLGFNRATSTVGVSDPELTQFRHSSVAPKCPHLAVGGHTQAAHPPKADIIIIADIDLNSIPQASKTRIPYCVLVDR